MLKQLLRDVRLWYFVGIVYILCEGSTTRREHLEEMYVRLNGGLVYYSRAVNHEGKFLVSYITKARCTALHEKAIKRDGAPKKITTDGLRSYGAAMNQRQSGMREIAAGPTAG